MLERMTDDEEQGFLPLSPEEYERRKNDVLAQGGIICDVYEDTGQLVMSLSPEAKARIAKRAARRGLDVETYLRKIWQDQVARALAERKP